MHHQYNTNNNWYIRVSDIRNNTNSMTKRNILDALQNDNAAHLEAVLLDYGTHVLNTRELAAIINSFRFDKHPYQTLLHLACLVGREMAMRFRIYHKSDVNVLDVCGNALIHMALRGAHEVIVRLLVGAGAHINAGDEDGTTPLEIAV